MSRSRRRTSSNGRKGTADRAAAARQFWGHELTEEPGTVTLSDDPAAMVRSLGPPPLRGQERTATQAFELIYQRAAHLAFGAAAAAGVAEVDDGATARASSPQPAAAVARPPRPPARRSCARAPRGRPRWW